MEQLFTRSLRLRPHHRENTGSRPITEVKSCRAASVPGWGDHLGIRRVVDFWIHFWTVQEPFP